jgi:nucleotide-binding universal stress UspA family protein
MYQRILVPVDGSPTSDQGLEEALRIAKTTGGSLRLVHVVNELIFSTGFEFYSADVAGVLREGGEAILAEARARAAASGIDVSSALLECFGGRICDFVVDEAKNWHADLIVIGSHGRHGIDRFLIGSDAEQILHVAPMPVLLVRATAAKVPAAQVGKQASVRRFQRILVPIDDNSTANWGLIEAIRIGIDNGSRLCLMHVLDAAAYTNGFEPAGVFCNEVLPLMKRTGEHVLAKAKAEAEAAGLTAECVLIESMVGRVSDLVVEKAASWAADLIVVGTHRRHGVDRFFMGSDAEQILRRGSIPVLRVRSSVPTPLQLAPAQGCAAASVAA